MKLPGIIVNGKKLYPSKKAYVMDGKLTYFGDIRIGKNNIRDGKLHMYPYDVVKGNFTIIQHSGLTSLKGCPKEIHGYFFASNNKITSLKDGPVRVETATDIRNNPLTSLEGFPYGNQLYAFCDNNKMKIKNLHAQYLYASSETYDRDDYWKGLLQHMIKCNLNILDVKWPKGILNGNLGRSIDGIQKFQL